MAPFMSDSGDCSTTDTVYDLNSIVCHHGRGIDTGHYTAFCHDSDRGIGVMIVAVLSPVAQPCCLPSPILDTWLWFDDDKVKVCAAGDVTAAQAYLLFYQLRGSKYSEA